MRRQTRRVKLSEHHKVTYVPTKLSNDSPKVLRITVTDPYATDSSSDDDDEEDVKVISPTPRVKRYVEEIRFGETEAKKDDGDDELVKPKKRYRGIRPRTWGKFGAEIRDPLTGSQIWLGTYDTAEEAAMIYDQAAIQLKGHKAQTNFLTPPPLPKPETKQVIEPEKISPEKKKSVGVVEEEELQTSLFPGLCSLAGWSLADDYMWKSEIAPETLFVKPFLNTEEGNLVEDFSFDLIDVFDSSFW